MQTARTIKIKLHAIAYYQFINIFPKCLFELCNGKGKWLAEKM